MQSLNVLLATVVAVVRQAGASAVTPERVRQVCPARESTAAAIASATDTINYQAQALSLSSQQSIAKWLAATACSLAKALTGERCRPARDASAAHSVE
jgi:hypothetical protein